jgi:hypothetical protein
VWRRCAWTLGKWGPSWKPGEMGDLARQEGERTDSWHQTVEEGRHCKMFRAQETGSSQNQATFMHRVCTIICCALVTISTTITGIVFYCIICFRRINHLVVKNHLHSSSGVREDLSSTIIDNEGDIIVKKDIYLGYVSEREWTWSPTSPVNWAMCLNVLEWDWFEWRPWMITQGNHPSFLM